MTLISLLLSLNLLSVTPQAVLDGRAELYSRQYSEALSFFEAALKENPKNLEAVLGKIDALCYTKKNKEAFSFADAVYAPGTPEYKMIQIYKDLWDRKNKDAKTKLLALISEKPQFHIAHYHLGWVYFREKDLDQAIASLKKCIALEPDYAPALYLLGRCYSKKNDVNQVMKYYELYLNVVPPKGARYQHVKDYISKMKG